MAGLAIEYQEQGRYGHWRRDFADSLPDCLYDLLCRVGCFPGWEENPCGALSKRRSHAPGTKNRMA